MSNLPSIGSPQGPGESTCGYCSEPGSRSESWYNRKTASLGAMQLSCQAYQKMIDRGWRRSGTYCYKPDLKTSCCPQYTIKLDALAFKPSKSQRKVINRWNRYIMHGKDAEIMGQDTPKKQPARKKTEDFSLSAAIHAAEYAFVPEGEAVSHRFEVTLEPSTYTDEKYALFEMYQEEIHKDFDNSRSGFKRFLVDSPLILESIPYPSRRPSHLPTNYGSYHQLYRLDGKLIALAVLDILPNCVSSVYFIYDKAWEKFSLGKLSAFRETMLAREIHDVGVQDMSYLYMGYYIYSCPKMRYKGEYAPSYLADPETYEWFPLETCVKLLGNNRYACFSHPEHSDANPPPSHTDHSDPPVPPVSDLQQVQVVKSMDKDHVIVEPFYKSRYWKNEFARGDFLACIHGLGMELAKLIILGY